MFRYDSGSALSNSLAASQAALYLACFGPRQWASCQGLAWIDAQRTSPTSSAGVGRMLLVSLRLRAVARVPELPLTSAVACCLAGMHGPSCARSDAGLVGGDSWSMTVCEGWATGLVPAQRGAPKTLLAFETH